MPTMEALRSAKLKLPFLGRSGSESLLTICRMFIPPSGVSRRQSLAPEISARLKTSPPPKIPSRVR